MCNFWLSASGAICLCKCTKKKSERQRMQKSAKMQRGNSHKNEKMQLFRKKIILQIKFKIFKKKKANSRDFGLCKKKCELCSLQIPACGKKTYILWGGQIRVHNYKRLSVVVCCHPLLSAVIHCIPYLSVVILNNLPLQECWY